VDKRRELLHMVPGTSIKGENSETIKIAAATTTSEVHIECEEKE
jgi:hypothetical protein